MYGIYLTLASLALLAYVMWRVSSLPRLKKIPRRAFLPAVLLLALVIASERWLGHGNFGFWGSLLPFVSWTLVGTLFLVFVCLFPVDLLLGFGLFFPRRAARIRGWAMLAGCLLAAAGPVPGAAPAAGGALRGRPAGAAAGARRHDAGGDLRPPSRAADRARMARRPRGANTGPETRHDPGAGRRLRGARGARCRLSPHPGQARGAAGGVGGGRQPRDERPPGRAGRPAARSCLRCATKRCSRRRACSWPAAAPGTTLAGRRRRRCGTPTGGMPTAPRS